MKGSISGLHRALMCPASLLLPQTSSTSEDNTVGHVVHDFLSKVPELGVAAALDTVPDEHRPLCNAITLADLPLDTTQWAHEVAFAIDLAAGTARELGRGLNRQYEGRVEPGELPGTADVVGLGDDYVVIIDYKTGWANLGRPKSNWQLLGYAVAACWAYGKRRARLVVLPIRDGEVFPPQEDWVEEMDLDIAAMTIAELPAKVAALEATPVAELPTHEGPWCRYCPAFDRCPSKWGLVRMAAREMTGGFHITDLGERHLADAVVFVEQLEALAERMRGVLELRALREPIDLGNGEVLGPKEITRREVVVEKAGGYLTSRFGADILGHVVQRLPNAVIERFVKAEGPGPRGRERSVGRRMAALWDELKALGALRIRTTRPVMRHRPKALPEGAPETIDETGT